MVDMWMISPSASKKGECWKNPHDPENFDDRILVLGG
jgi:hypothetical protein